MARQKFGGQHTEQKLAALEAYLRAYTTALKNQPFSLAFFDAFAGTGKIEIQTQDAPLLDGLDAEQFIDGSAQRALRCDPKFNEYVMVEKSRSKARDLDKLKLDYPQNRRSDSNQARRRERRIEVVLRGPRVAPLARRRFPRSLRKPSLGEPSRR